jgi:hypothetical protein
VLVLQAHECPAAVGRDTNFGCRRRVLSCTGARDLDELPPIESVDADGGETAASGEIDVDAVVREVRRGAAVGRSNQRRLAAAGRHPAQIHVRGLADAADLRRCVILLNVAVTRLDIAQVGVQLVGPRAGEIHDSAAIGGIDRLGIVRGMPRQLFGLAAWCRCDAIEMAAFVRPRDERDGSTVRRPGRHELALSETRQPFRLAARHVHDPHMVERAEDDAAAVGRDVRPADQLCTHRWSIVHAVLEQEARCDLGLDACAEGNGARSSGRHVHALDVAVDRHDERLSVRCEAISGHRVA